MQVGGRVPALRFHDELVAARRQHADHCLALGRDRAAVGRLAAVAGDLHRLA